MGTGPELTRNRWPPTLARSAHLVEETVAHAGDHELRLLENLDQRVVLLEHKREPAALARAVARLAEESVAGDTHGRQHRAERGGAVEHHAQTGADIGRALGRLDEARAARPARQSEQLRLEASLHRVQLRRPTPDAGEGQAGKLVGELDQLVNILWRYPPSTLQHARKLRTQRVIGHLFAPFTVE